MNQPSLLNAYKSISYEHYYAKFLLITLIIAQQFIVFVSNCNMLICCVTKATKFIIALLDAYLYRHFYTEEKVLIIFCPILVPKDVFVAFKLSA